MNGKPVILLDLTEVNLEEEAALKRQGALAHDPGGGVQMCDCHPSIAWP